MKLDAPFTRLLLAVLFSTSSTSAFAANVEITLTSDLPEAPTGLLFAKGGLYGGAVLGIAAHGTIYQLLPPSRANAKWSVGNASIFHQEAGDGAFPAGSLITDKAGNLYGATFGGGDGNGVGNGTLYKLSVPAPSQSPWIHQNIYLFQTPVDSSQVQLAIDANNRLYMANETNVLQFKPPASGSGSYTMTSIAIVPGYTADGSGVVADRWGALYGVARATDSARPTYNIVYKLTPPGTANAQWTSTILHTFDPTAHVGQLRLFRDGHLIDTTSPVGTKCSVKNCAVFELSPTGGQAFWTEKIIHSFAGDPLGNPPNNIRGSPYLAENYVLSEGPGSVIYGAITSNQNTAAVNSTIYRITPPASGQTAWTETALYTFQSKPYGFSAGTPMYIAENGSIYGTAYGGVPDPYTNQQQSIAFKIAP